LKAIAGCEHSLEPGTIISIVFNQRNRRHVGEKNTVREKLTVKVSERIATRGRQELLFFGPPQ
jgi:hypothetical protein